MSADNVIGLFIDYEYVHRTLERAYQTNPDPGLILDEINRIVDEKDINITLKRVYALWAGYPDAKHAFAAENYQMVDATCGLNGENNTGLDKKTVTGLDSLELTLCCDIMESVNDHEIQDFYLLLGDSKYEVLIKRLKDKQLNVNLLGFNRNTPQNLKQHADSYINLDQAIKRFHREDLANIIETFISLSRKLPYVGYKYLMDLLSRNDLHTDYRQLLNEAQEEGIIQLIEVDDPNTMRGKAFAVRLVPEHPLIVKYLQETGLTQDALTSFSQVDLQENHTDTFNPPGCEDHSDSRFTTGKRLVEIGQHEAAISEFFNYLDDYPNDFLGFVYVINCLIKNGDRKLARVWCKKALELPNTTQNQKEYPRWFSYMKRVSSMNTESYTDEEERIELSG